LSSEILSLLILFCWIGLPFFFFFLHFCFILFSDVFHILSHLLFNIVYFFVLISFISLFIMFLFHFSVYTVLL
jgi:hypothetical protein